MRRPALHRPLADRRPARAAALPGWAHPYTGPAAHATFYNDGGNPPATPPAAPPATPPVPGPPAAPPAPQQDPKEFTQADLDRIAAREKAQGKRSALADFAKEHGFNSIEDAQAFITAARDAQQAALSEQEKREKALADKEAALAAREAAAATREASARRRIVLAGLGATGADLEDAEALLRTGDDADDATLSTAAEALKARRPELFGATTTPAAPGTPPPAPGGAPAGGPPPRQTPAGKPGDRGRQMAILRGHRKPDAA